MATRQGRSRAGSEPQVYDEKSIKRLVFPDNVRHRPTMYLGGRGDQMVFQCVKELFDNCSDEFFAGRNKSVFIHIDNKNNRYLVADEAQGIPVGLVPVNPEQPKGPKASTLTLVFSELHTGGKFDDKAYSISRGTHGVGAACVNAVAASFEVWTHRDRAWHYQKFLKGKAVGGVLKSAPPAAVANLLPAKPTKGTIVLFSVDQSVVAASPKTPAKLDLPFTAAWMKAYANLNPGLRITLSANGKTRTYLNTEGLMVLVKQKLAEYEATPTGKPFVYTSDNMSLAVQWSTYAEDNGLSTFVCSGRTIHDGEHEVGFRSALFAALAPYRKKNQKVAPKDLYSGLVGVFDYRMHGAEYSGQTKDKLESNVSKQVEQELTPVLSQFFDKNKAVARAIVRRALEVKASKEAFKKQLTAIATAKKSSKSSLPSGLTAAPRCTPAARELYLLEGDSAGGTAKKARDSHYQEVMKLDGKIMNVARKQLHAILESQKVLDILSSIGYNFDCHKAGGRNQNPYSNLRVGKVILLPDADEDGHHIRVLILTLLHKMMPKLFDEGRVYVVDAPLYSAFWKNKRYFGDTFKEVESQLPKDAPSQKIISRAKGWGEISPEMLEHVAFNPATRTIIRVKPMVEADAVRFERLVGSETAARKELLGL